MIKKLINRIKMAINGYGDFSEEQTILGDNDFIRLDGKNGQLFVEGKLIVRNKGVVRNIRLSLMNMANHQAELARANRELADGLNKKRLRCSFCGGQARIKYDAERETRYVGYCDNCDVVLEVYPEDVCRLVNS